MTEANKKTIVNRGDSSYHGHVFSPESIAYYAWLDGQVDVGTLNQLESGKFLPKASGGLADEIAPTNLSKNAPPRDGKIASGNQAGASFLDEPGTDWEVASTGNAFYQVVDLNFSGGDTTPPKQFPDDKVAYHDKVWVCTQAHSSILTWAPSLARGTNYNMLTHNLRGCRPSLCSRI